MATIYSEKFAGEKNWNDPSAWVGGVVPTGSGDVAYIESGFTRVNFSNGYRPWTGSQSTIRVDSVSGFPTTSGSFYAYTYLTSDYVKIDYTTVSGNDFVSCSIDHSFVSWSADLSGSLRDGKAYGILRNDTPVFRTDHTVINLSGSDSWHISQVHVRDHGCFKIKNTARLILDSTSRDAYVGVRDGKFEMIDQTSAILTGSTERNSSLIHHYNDNYSQVIVSGSTDHRTRTRTTSNVAVRSGVFPVQSATNFGEGDVVSIYDDDDLHVLSSFNTNNNEYEPYYFTRSGSVWPYYKAEKPKDQDEVFYVHGTNGNNLNVGKMYAPEGVVLSTDGAVNRRVYQKEFGRARSRFTGTKTSITVRSGNNGYERGQRVLIGNSVYTILEVADKLIPYKTLDFENGANLNDFYVDTDIGSGSSADYKIHADLITGSRLEMSGSVVGTNSHYKSVFLKDCFLRDLKVTITGSILRQEANAYGGAGNYNSNRMFGVSICDDPYDRDKVLAFYNRPGYSRASYIGIYDDDVYYGSRTDHWGRIDVDHLNGVNNITSGSREGDVRLEIEAIRENVKFTYQGQELNNATINRKAGSVALHLRKEGSSIKKVVVEEYVQQLLLDTTDSISPGSSVYLSGTEVFHPSNQRVVKLGTHIKDLRGYKNLPSLYASGITGSIIPTQLSNDGDTDLYRNSSTTDNRARMGSIFHHITHYDYYYRVVNSGDAFFDLNLGEATTFDAIGLAHFYSMPSHYNNGTWSNIGVEYSNDGATWSTAKAKADDTRIGQMAADYRIYTFSEVTAKFVRIHVGGTSHNSRNYILAAGLYHFNGRGSSIELYNAADLSVGDSIGFFHPQQNRGHGYNSGVLMTAYRSNILNGSKTASDYVGHNRLYYTITAKSGNVITLDRLIEGEEIYHDTLVYKFDRGITVKSNAGTGHVIPFGLYYADSSSNTAKVIMNSIWARDLGGGSRERMYFYRYPYSSLFEVSNCSFHYIEKSNIYSNDGGQYRKNNLWINVHGFYNAGSRMYKPDINHGEIHRCYAFYARGKYSVDSRITGNIVESGRYLYGANNHSTPYSPGTGKLTIRNTYFTWGDYYNHQSGADHSSEREPAHMEYYDNVERSGAGYNRYYKIHNRLHANQKSRVDANRLYPAIHPHGYIFRTECNFNYYESMGTDYLTLAPFYGHKNFSRRNYLVDNGRRLIIQNRDNSNQYDIVNIALNRVDPVLVAASFAVYSPQEIRVNQKIEYKNSFGHYYDNYLGGVGNDNKALRGILIYENKTITSKISHPTLEFKEFEFDHSFNALPGNYLYVLLQRSRQYCQHLLTFKKMSFAVTGAAPENVVITQNGFNQYRLLKKPEKIQQGLFFPQQKVAKKVTNRRTIKFRKFKF